MNCRDPLGRALWIGIVTAGTTAGWAEAQSSCDYYAVEFAPSIPRDLVVHSDWMAAGHSAAVRMLKWDGRKWVIRQTISGPEGSWESLALGDTCLLFGDEGADEIGPGSGAVYVYRLDAQGNWVTDQVLTFPDYRSGDEGFGIAVDMDGDVAVIAARLRSGRGGGGAVYVFRQTSGSWHFEQELTTPYGLYPRSARSVGISGDTILVGKAQTDPADPRSYVSLVFRWDGAAWLLDQEVQYANHLDIAGDRAVITFGNNQIVVLERTGDDWLEQMRTDAPFYVTSVALDGDQFLIGGGAAQLYQYDGQRWTNGARLAPPAEAGNAFGGISAFDYTRVVVADADRLFFINPVGEPDCNDNGLHDACEDPIDCNGNGIADECDLTAGTSEDCNSNGIPDECIQDESDCNGNLIPDECDVAAGTSDDCNFNLVPDQCESLDDCNTNGIQDFCDVANGTSYDCDGSGLPDECEPSVDCNGNGWPDRCDILEGTSEDCSFNGVPDECEVDCNGNGIADSCDLRNYTSSDCNHNGIPDDCDRDCNHNNRPDDCDLSGGLSEDCDRNGVPDECQPADDCNNNGMVDGCEIAEGITPDCDGNGLPDECQPGNDCNGNNVPDDCDLAEGSSNDCNANGVPDECDQDCDKDGVPDVCELATGTAVDTDGDGLPDKCEGKNRAISFSPDQAGAVAGGLLTAVRVTLLDVNGFESFNGEVRWVGPPEAFSEDTNPPMPNYVAGTLQCCPYFRDWSGAALSAEFGPDADVSQVHIVGASIVPNSDYALQVVDSSCLDLSDEGCYSAATPLGTARFGDVWEPFGVVGQPNFLDIAKVVEKYKGVSFDPGPPAAGAPIEVRAMLRGRVPPLSDKVNFMDIGDAVSAYKGIPYRELGPFECTDPCE